MRERRQRAAVVAGRSRRRLRPQRLRDQLEQSAAYGYTVKGSPDGRQWTALASAAGATTDQVREHAFAAMGVRYLRIDIDRSTGKWASIFEVAVFPAR